MNALTTQNVQLPAHLQHLAQNTSLSAGLSVSSGWPRISIKGARFRLQSPQGEEVVVNTLDLDVVIVDANPNGLSKVFYNQAYDPKTDDGAFKAPNCWSDNGVGPSSKASAPQCGTCAVCPHNVWGSKIAANGAQTKACSDVKKVAVLIAANPDGPVFELRIPPASLKNFASYVDSLDKRGIPGAAIVTKLKFDTTSDYPKLVFEASGWATAEQANAVMEVLGTEEVDQCTGKNDKPVDPARVGAAATTQIAQTPQQQFTAAVPPPPAVTVAAPLPPMTNAAPRGFPLPPAMAPASAPVDPLSSGAPAMATPKRARGANKPPVASDTSGTLGAPPLHMPPVMAPSGPVAPSNPVNTVAPLVPTAVSNSALDDLLAKAMQA